MRTLRADRWPSVQAIPAPLCTTLSLPLWVGNGGGEKKPASVHVLGLPGNLTGVSGFHDLAAVHDRDPMAYVTDHSQIVGDKQVGCTSPLL